MFEDDKILTIPSVRDLDARFSELEARAGTPHEWDALKNILALRDALQGGFNLRGRLTDEHVVYSLKQEGTVNALAISNDGNYLATGSSKGLLVVSAISSLILDRLDQTTRLGTTSPIYSLAFERNSGLLFIGTKDQGLSLINTKTCLDPTTDRVPNLQISCPGQITSISTSNKHDKIGLTGEGFVAIVSLNDACNQIESTKVTTIKEDDLVYCGVFAGNHSFYIYSDPTGCLVATSIEPNEQEYIKIDNYRQASCAYGMSYHAESQQLAVVGPGYIDLVRLDFSDDLPKIERVRSMKISELAYSASFTKDGRLLAVGLDRGGVGVYDAELGNQFKQVAEYRPDINIAPKIDPSNTSIPAKEFEKVKDIIPVRNPTNSVRFCLNDTSIMAASEDGFARLIGDQNVLSALVEVFSLEK